MLLDHHGSFAPVARRRCVVLRVSCTARRAGSAGPSRRPRSARRAGTGRTAGASRSTRPSGRRHRRRWWQHRGACRAARRIGGGDRAPARCSVRNGRRALVARRRWLASGRLQRSSGRDRCHGRGWTRGPDGRCRRVGVSHRDRRRSVRLWRRSSLGRRRSTHVRVQRRARRDGSTGCDRADWTAGSDGAARRNGSDRSAGCDGSDGSTRSDGSAGSHRSARRHGCAGSHGRAGRHGTSGARRALCHRDRAQPR